MDVDRSGTDSTAIALRVRRRSCWRGSRFALMHEYRERSEFELEDLLARMSPCDWFLSGFKRTPIPKLEVQREERQVDLLANTDEMILAVAADYEIPNLDIPVFNLNDTLAIADFIWDHLHV